MIFQVALIANATSIFISHNHPSGKKRPSGEGDTLTKQIQEANKVMFIRLLDHIIVTPENGFFHTAMKDGYNSRNIIVYNSPHNNIFY